MDTQTKPLNQFIAEQNLKFECRSVPSRPDGLMDGDMYHFRCKFTSTSGIYQNKSGFRVASNKPHSFSVYFSMGIAHAGKEPTIEEVLDCLAMDAASYEN